MQLSLDQKIQAAVSPLLERIAAIEAQNKLFKQEIILLQSQAQQKSTNKPSNFVKQEVNKTASEHVVRPKNVKKENQLHQIKTQVKVIHKSAQKKEQHKMEGDESKTESNKAVGVKTPILSNKAIASPALHKGKSIKDLESNDPKNVKSKPITHPVSKPTNTDITSKVATIDKKQPQHKNNQGQPDKKQADQEKKHASKQREHKINSTHAIKSPVFNKNKPIQAQPPNKKITAQIKVEPKPLKGVKPKTTTQIKSQKVQKEEHGPKVQETQLYSPEQKEQAIAKEKGQVAKHGYLQMQNLQKPEQEKEKIQQNQKKSEQKQEKGVKVQKQPQSGLVGIQQQTS